MIKKPLFAVYFVKVESVIRNTDGSWTFTYNTVGGRDDNLSNAVQFDKDFQFPLHKLIPGKLYVIRYKLHNHVMQYEKAYEINIVKEII